MRLTKISTQSDPRRSAQVDYLSLFRNYQETTTSTNARSKIQSWARDLGCHSFRFDLVSSCRQRAGCCRFGQRRAGLQGNSVERRWYGLDTRRHGQDNAETGFGLGNDDDERVGKRQGDVAS